MDSMEAGFYRHYKGTLYEVIGMARHSETLEELVVYKATYQNEEHDLWVRPLSMFLETVSFNRTKVERFTKVSGTSH